MKKKSILLVDDDPELLADLRQSFESRGYTVYTENTVRSAKGRMKVLAYQHNHLDALVVDDKMTEDAGKDLIEWAGTHYPKVKCILFAGYCHETKNFKFKSPVVEKNNMISGVINAVESVSYLSDGAIRKRLSDLRESDRLKAIDLAVKKRRMELTMKIARDREDEIKLSEQS